MSKSELKIERRRLRSGYITSTVSITLLLILLGSVGVLVFNANALRNYILENLTVKIFLQKDLKQERINAIRFELTQRPIDYIKEDKSGQKEIVFVDSTTAAIEYQEELGEEFIKHIGSNPLPNAYFVKLKAKYATPENIGMVEEDLMSIAGVQEVHYQKNLIQEVNRNINQISLIVLLFSSLLLLIALTLINNTIRLAIYSKRFIIRTMQLVGATASYIRTPFLYRSILQGAIGALLAAVVITGVVHYIQQKIQGTIPLDDPVTLLKIYGIVFSLGILINGISTWIAVTKYLKIKTDQLYN